MLDFKSVLVFSENHTELANFYKKVFGKSPDMEENGYSGFQIGSGFFTIGPHDKVKGKTTNPERIMFNFETSDVKNEFERIKAAGATVIAEPYQMGETWIATFADLDGNYFQLMTPWESK